MKNNDKNDKFVWQKGDIQIFKTQCEMCIYHNLEDADNCELYPNGKPEEVSQNKIICKKMKKKEEYKSFFDKLEE